MAAKVLKLRRGSPTATLPFSRAGYPDCPTFGPESIGAGSLVTPAEEWTDAWSRPTRLSGLVFRSKAMALQTKRAARDGRSGRARLRRADAEGFPVLLGQ